MTSLQEIEELLPVWQERAHKFNEKRRKRLADAGHGIPWPSSSDMMDLLGYYQPVDFIAFENGWLVFVDHNYDSADDKMGIPYAIIDGEVDEDAWIDEWATQIIALLDAEKADRKKAKEADERATYERLARKFQQNPQP